ncbi:MAG: MmcB family DNA repair protein [Hyphomicrobiaceae bacterium]|nr:MmcB family DNA repair protein [Hyphomicrobiaceae bacterium]
MPPDPIRDGVLSRTNVAHNAAIADGRQSDAAFQICRGVVRLIAVHGMAAFSEVGLANGRRADVVGLGGDGEIVIVEIKSCLEDFRSDAKWPEYRPFCDRLFFAVDPRFPHEVLPGDAGLIIADRYGGEIVREAPVHKLPAARRKALTLQVARLAAFRLQSVIDPEARLEAWARG